MSLLPLLLEALRGPRWDPALSHAKVLECLTSGRVYLSVLVWLGTCCRVSPRGARPFLPSHTAALHFTSKGRANFYPLLYLLPLVQTSFYLFLLPALAPSLRRSDRWITAGRCLQWALVPAASSLEELQGPHRHLAVPHALNTGPQVITWALPRPTPASVMWGWSLAAHHLEELQGSLRLPAFSLALIADCRRSHRARCPDHSVWVIMSSLRPCCCISSKNCKALSAPLTLDSSASTFALPTPCLPHLPLPHLAHALSSRMQMITLG